MEASVETGCLHRWIIHMVQWQNLLVADYPQTTSWFSLLPSSSVITLWCTQHAGWLHARGNVCRRFLCVCIDTGVYFCRVAFPGTFKIFFKVLHNPFQSFFFYVASYLWKSNTTQHSISPYEVKRGWKRRFPLPLTIYVLVLERM